MLYLKNQRGLILCIVVTFMILEMSLPTDVEAQWHSRHEELPGMMSTEEVILYALVITGGVILISSMISNKKEESPKDYLEKEKTDSTSTETSFEWFEQNLNSKNEIENKRIESKKAKEPFKIWLSTSNYGIKAMDLNEKYLGFKNRTIALGLNLTL